MKRYLIYLGVSILMIGSFFISWLFFINSGLVDVQGNGIDNEKSIKVLAELDRLPLIKIDAYEIIFNSKGEISGINSSNLEIMLSSGKKEIFDYKGNFSEYEIGEKIKVYYTYLPEGNKKVVRLEKILK